MYVMGFGGHRTAAVMGEFFVTLLVYLSYAYPPGNVLLRPSGGRHGGRGVQAMRVSRRLRKGETDNGREGERETDRQTETRYPVSAPSVKTYKSYVDDGFGGVWHDSRQA